MLSNDDAEDTEAGKLPSLMSMLSEGVISIVSGIFGFVLFVCRGGLALILGFGSVDRLNWCTMGSLLTLFYPIRML